VAATTAEHTNAATNALAQSFLIGLVLRHRSPVSTGERPSTDRLVCAECGRQADVQAEGWRAYLTDDEPKEIRTFCPDCAEHEFGDE
jgi:hypothetical protein